MALAFVQRPGQLVGDTKLDLTADPARFLARALVAWAPAHQGGELANQSIGYLLPMGGFFELGHAAGLPGWVVQRLWLALVLVIAFLGVQALARQLGIGSPWARLLGAVAYLATPGVLGLAQTNSAELLPYLLTPWLVLPLLRWGSRAPWLAASVGALAVAALGGANASAALLVVPVVPLAVLLAPLGHARLLARLLLLGRWLVCTVLVTCWWTVPLVVLGRYGFNFLPYTESASTTTLTTGLATVLQGSEHWVEHLAVRGQFQRPAAAHVLTSWWPLLAAGVAPTIGLLGLTRRGLPARTFLLTTFVAGLVVVSAGHAVSVAAPAFGAPVRDLLDGVGAPLRNLAKADALVRLPLSLGFAHLLDRWLRQADPARRFRARVGMARRRLAATGTGVAVAGLAGVSVLALAPGLAPDPGYSALPGYWSSAAAWLDRQAGPGSVLVEPAAAFGEFGWGRPMDEPLQALLKNRPWLARAQSAAGSAGLTRVLNAIDDDVVTGQGGVDLAAALPRIGVRWVLVRTDLDSSRNPAVWGEQVVQSLTDSGLVRAAAFGPLIGTPPSSDGVVTQGFGQPQPAVSVWEVPSGDGTSSSGISPVTRAPLGDLVRVDGAPDDVTRGAAALADSPTVLAGDPGSDLATHELQADGLRRRELSFGPLRETPVTMTARQPYLVRRPAHDLLEPDWTSPTVVATTGDVTITASSSSSDPGAVATADTSPSPDTSAVAAVDGHTGTGWVSDARGAVGQWWQIGFATPRLVNGTLVTPYAIPGETSVATRYRITTDSGHVDIAVPGNGGPVRLDTALEPTRTLRITVSRVAGAAIATSSVGLAEVAVPGVTVTRSLLLPAVAGTHQQVQLTRSGPATAPCARAASGGWLCGSLLETPSEEPYSLDRQVVTHGTVTGPLTGTAVLAADSSSKGSASPVERAAIVAATGRDWVVLPSSELSTSAPAWGYSAVDGDPDTAWWADPADASPTLTVGVPDQSTITGIHLTLPARGVSRAITAVEVSAGGQTRSALVGPSGQVEFAPLAGTVFTVRLVAPPAFTASVSGQPGLVGVAVSGLDLNGVATPYSPVPNSPVTLPCGAGPTIEVGGSPVSTSVTTTVGALRTGRPVPFRACEPVTLAPGETDVVATDGVWRVATVVIGQLPRAADDAPAPRIVQWGSTRRSVQVAAAPASLLVTDENRNAGWVATLHGQQLRSVRLDGWRQGWVLPAGAAGTVQLRFTAQPAVTAALIAGGAGLLAVATLAGCAARLGRRGRRPRAVQLAAATPRSARHESMRWTAMRWTAMRWTAATAEVAILAALGSTIGAAAGLAAAALMVGWPRRQLHRLAQVGIGWLVPLLVAEVVVGVAALVAPRFGLSPTASDVEATRQLLTVLALAAVGPVVLAGGWGSAAFDLRSRPGPLSEAGAAPAAPRPSG